MIALPQEEFAKPICGRSTSVVCVEGPLNQFGASHEELGLFLFCQMVALAGVDGLEPEEQLSRTFRRVLERG